MLIHGGCMEIGGVLLAVPAIIPGPENFYISRYFSFPLPYFQENLYFVPVMGAILGVMCVIGTIGLIKRRMVG